MSDPSQKPVMAVKELTAEQKENFKEWAKRPEYGALIRALAQEMQLWRLLHPAAKLVWVDTGRGLILGDPSSDLALGLLAESPDAVACLRYADERTGKKATLMTLQLALDGLGWTRS